MDAPSMKVNCGVENCHYNKSKMCYADQLEVNAMRSNQADTSDGTSCVTFKPGK